MLLESSDGKTAREFAQLALEGAREKKPSDVSTKKQIENLQMILQILPDDDIRLDDIHDEQTPQRPLIDRNDTNSKYDRSNQI